MLLTRCYLCLIYEFSHSVSLTSATILNTKQMLHLVPTMLLFRTKGCYLDQTFMEHLAILFTSSASILYFYFILTQVSLGKKNQVYFPIKAR